MTALVEDHAAIAQRAKELRGCRVRAGGMAADCWCRRPDGSYAPCPIPTERAAAPDPLALVRRRCAELGIRPLWAK